MLLYLGARENAISKFKTLRFSLIYLLNIEKSKKSTIKNKKYLQLRGYVHLCYNTYGVDTTFCLF